MSKLKTAVLSAAAGAFVTVLTTQAMQWTLIKVQIGSPTTTSSEPYGSTDFSPYGSADIYPNNGKLDYYDTATPPAKGEYYSTYSPNK